MRPARNTDLLGPPGICDNCGRPCQGLHQAGIRCYHCHAGRFIHRGEWKYVTCPECNRYGCDACKQTGVTAVRIAQAQ